MEQLGTFQKAHRKVLADVRRCLATVNRLSSRPCTTAERGIEILDLVRTTPSLVRRRCARLSLGRAVIRENDRMKVKYPTSSHRFFGRTSAFLREAVSLPKRTQRPLWPTKSLTARAEDGSPW